MLVKQAKAIRIKLSKLPMKELQQEMELAEEMLLTPLPYNHPWLALASIVYMASKIQIQKRKGVQHV